VESSKLRSLEVDEVPAFRWSFAEPTGWARVRDHDSKLVYGELFDEQAVVHGPTGSGFYVRASLKIPVLDAPQDLVLTVWASVRGDHFERMHVLWQDPRRVDEAPYATRLCNRIPGYPDTWHLAGRLHTQPVGFRPLVELDRSDHPLAIDQRRGITASRVSQISDAFECRV